MATILCIEDEADIREDIVESMENAGHTVLQACDGQQRLEMILKNAPDMVVSDITMPNKNGHQLLAKVRADYPKFDDMPFIFLSALADQKDILDGMDLGADDYLTKPVDFAMLGRKVEARLREIERIRKHNDQDLVKLFKALSGDIPDIPVTAASAVPAGTAEPKTVVHPIAKEPKKQTTPAVDKVIQPSKKDENQQKIYGSVFKFGDDNTIEDQSESQREDVLDWLVTKGCKFLSRILPAGVSVSKAPNSGILVCYPNGDKDEPKKQSKQIATKLEEHILKDHLDELAQKTTVSREMLAHFVVVTEALYETEIELGDIDDPDRFSAAIQEQVDKISTDERAPTRLSLSIKQNNGHLLPLTLVRQDGVELPINFFNFDEISRAKIRSSFALFSRENLIKAGCLIDLLVLSLLENESKKINRKYTIVVDVHFETLNSDSCLDLYLPKFMIFANNSPHKIMVNIRAIPSNMPSQRLDHILKPLGKYATRCFIQVSPRTVEELANAQLTVSTIVCSYSEMVQSPPDCSLFMRAKPQFLEAGTLLILRGLPLDNEITNFSKYGFDGYAMLKATRKIEI